MRSIEILLVDDNAGDVMLIRQALRGHLPPVSAHVARDGEQALLMLTDPPIESDLIILDLNIPRINGQPCWNDGKLREHR